jgi:hypothetical protein
MENGVKQSILAPPVGGAVGGAKRLLFSPISELQPKRILGLTL